MNQGDLASGVIDMCRQLCDIAHVLSRMTLIPTPKDNFHKDTIKEGLKSLNGDIQVTRARVLALSDLAVFDSTEIRPEPEDVDEDVQAKIDALVSLAQGEKDMSDEDVADAVEAGIEMDMEEEGVDEDDRDEEKDKTISELLNNLAKRNKDNNDEADNES